MRSKFAMAAISIVPAEGFRLLISPSPRHPRPNPI